MLKNYLLVALRIIKRHWGYSFINAVGLAIGMAVCLLVLQYISYEKSYENFHKKRENLYRVELAYYIDGSLHEYLANSTRSLGPALKEAFPEVVDYARLYENGEGVVRYEDFSAKVEYIFLADPTFLTMFSFPLVKGNPATALAEPFSAVISESAAKRIFGDEDPMGKRIKYDRIEYWDYIIKGVFKDVPGNSHLRFDFLFSIHHIDNSDYFRNGWNSHNFFTYVLLNPHADVKALEAKLPGFLDKFIGERCRRNNSREVYSFQPISNIYLYSPDPGYHVGHGSLETIDFLTGIAIFILIIAWANYITLSTARAMERSREVGLRKVVGATRLKLVKQFIFESVLLNLAGSIFAVILVRIFTPGFNQLMGIPLSASLMGDITFWLALLIILIGGVLISGLYPALVLSSFKPITVLKGLLKSNPSGINSRKVLVIFQLVISIVLLAGTFTVYRQIDFMRSQDLGINIDQVLLVKGPVVINRVENIWVKMFTFFKEVREYPTVVSTTMGGVPGRNYISSTDINREGNPTSFMVRRCWMDFGFLDTFQIKLLAGRNFSREFATDHREAVLLNEKAVKMLGFDSPENAVNQYIMDDRGQTRLKIVGVVENYHQKSLKDDIEPVIFRYFIHYGSSFYSFKLNTVNIDETIAVIKDKWNKFLTGNPFDYIFLDDYFKRQYKAEFRFGQLFNILTILAIFIACIGLLGLAAYAALQKTREIAVRKVLGADVSSIIGLLTKDFIRWLIISSLIALPIAYYIFSKWLEEYAYRIEIGIWFFIVPVIIITSIVLITVIYHVVKAALQNPAESLRYE